MEAVIKSMDWFLYDNDLRHERVKDFVVKRRFRWLSIALFEDNWKLLLSESTRSFFSYWFSGLYDVEIKDIF